MPYFSFFFLTFFLKNINFAWDIPQKVASRACLFSGCFSTSFLKNINFAWDIPSKLRFKMRAVFSTFFTREHGISSFTSMPGPKLTCRLAKKINMFDATKMQNRAGVQARRLFSGYFNSQKNYKKMCSFLYNFGGIQLKKYASRAGATQISKNGHKKIISFFRVEAS